MKTKVKFKADSLHSYYKKNDIGYIDGYITDDGVTSAIVIIDRKIVFAPIYELTVIK